MSSVYAELVTAHGLSESHRHIASEIPDGARVLDVGCATGYLSAELVARGCTSVGIEYDPAAAQQARAVCREVVVGDLEAPAVQAEAADAVARAGGIDTIICGDVLEHLRDPWAVLAWLRTLLPADGGRAVISVPNIAHWPARRALLRGRFAYADFGLFDRTHLRFFTQASATELAQRAGFTVTEEHPAGAPLPLQSHLPALRHLAAPAVRRLPGLFALQFVLVLQPRP